METYAGKVDLPGVCKEDDELREPIISSDCNWNAVTLPLAVNEEGVAVWASQLQAAGAHVVYFLMPGRGVLLVSWRRPHAS